MPRLEALELPLRLALTTWQRLLQAHVIADYPLALHMGHG